MSRGISGNSPLLSSCLFSQQADFNGIGYIRKAVSLQYYSILNLILRERVETEVCIYVSVCNAFLLYIISKCSYLKVS